MSLEYKALSPSKPGKNIFTVDLEDWFHFEFGGFSVPMDSWNEMEGRIVSVTDQLLEVLNTHDANATFYILGWVAEKYPQVIRKIADLGHEIGCHTYCHHLVNQVAPEVFRADLRKAKTILEDASGQSVLNFRAPYFSIDHTSDWAFEVLCEEGFLYDSSIFPAKRMIGGSPSGLVFPHKVHTPSGEIYEMPISVIDVLGMRFTLFGGGYFRLLPFSLVSKAIHVVNKTGYPVNFYIHPHDLDAGQPRAEMGAFSKFRRYVGVEKTWGKLDCLLSQFHFSSMKQYFESVNAG